MTLLSYIKYITYITCINSEHIKTNIASHTIGPFFFSPKVPRRRKINRKAIGLTLAGGSSINFHEINIMRRDPFDSRLLLRFFFLFFFFLSFVGQHLHTRRSAAVQLRADRRRLPGPGSCVTRVMGVPRVTATRRRRRKRSYPRMISVFVPDDVSGDLFVKMCEFGGKCVV